MRSRTLKSCTLCPRACGADRSGDAVQTGFCGGGSSVKLARAALHFWEEPCVSGSCGSGTVFFSGCPLQCRFCQNHPISAGNFGREVTTERLAQIFLELQEQDAHNINLVNPTHYIPWILDALDLVRHHLHIPVVYNSGGYESVASLKLLEGYVDVYLPDLKYKSTYMSGRYSSAPDYFDFAAPALEEMFRQTGPVEFDEEGVICKGMIVRHLVLPGGTADSASLLRWLARTFGTGEILVSVMSQYTPCFRSTEYPEINRRITADEYETVTQLVRSLGLAGYFQDSGSAREEYTPPFDLTGV